MLRKACCKKERDPVPSGLPEHYGSSSEPRAVGLFRRPVRFRGVAIRVDQARQLLLRPFADAGLLKAGRLPGTSGMTALSFDARMGVGGEVYR